MSDNKAIDPNAGSADDLTKTTAKGNVELTEEELGKAAGGTKGEPIEYLKIKLTDVLISS
jgi:type VI protein secretion system component Hcp